LQLTDHSIRGCQEQAKQRRVEHAAACEGSGMEDHYRWTAEQGKGLEHLALGINGAGVHAEGVVIGTDGGMSFGCTYAIRCDKRWHVRSVEIRVARGPALLLESDGEGNWRNMDGRRIPSLAGCIDIDLSCTPFTNSLPIRRLGRLLAQRREITVAYIDVPRLGLGPSRQAYTCLGPGVYRFESLANPFSADIETDGDGLVLRYPGAFDRVPPDISAGR
jgi:hypothetical protein